MKVMRIAWLIFIAGLLSSCLCAGATLQRTNLQIALTGQSHPSGLYHVGDRTTLQIRINNAGTSVHMLSGNLHWVLKRGHGKSPTLLATTPIRPTMLTGGQIVRIALPETFSTVGRYELLWHRTPIRLRKPFQNPRCIYTPGSQLPGTATPWIAVMPRQFVSVHPPGFIASYVRETGLRLYFYNIRLPVDHRTDFQMLESRLARGLKRSGARLIPVLTVAAAATRLNHLISKQDLIAHLKPIIALCQAIVVRFSSAPTPATSTLVDKLIPRLHRALKALNSSAALFATPVVIGAGKASMNDTRFISGVALSDTYHSMRLCHQLEQSDAALPVMILPISSAPSLPEYNPVVPNPALFLASAATYVPVSTLSNNFGPHILGSGGLFSVVHPHLPLLTAVFKQTYGAVAIISGPGSGAITDHQWNTWRDNSPLMIKNSLWRTARADGNAGWKRILALMPPAGKFPRGKLIVVDAEGLMATRNTRGHPVPTPYPGWQEIPLNRRVYFLTYPGTPSDLAAALRTASINGLPVAEVTMTVNTSTKVTPTTVTLSIRNARVGRLQGSICLWKLGTEKKSGRCLQISPIVHFGPIHAGNAALVTLPVQHIHKISASEKLMAVLAWHQWIEITPLLNLSTPAAALPKKNISQSGRPQEPKTHTTGDKVALPPEIPGVTKKVIPSRIQPVQTVELPYMPNAKTR